METLKNKILSTLPGIISRNDKYEILSKEHFFELPDEKYRCYQIRAVRDFGDVRKGQLGGYVSGEHNLCPNGNCWIDETSYVLENARITEEAQVRAHSVVSGNAIISMLAEVYECQIMDHVVIDGSPIIENSQISGNAIVGGMPYILHASISGRAHIHGVADLRRVTVRDYANIHDEVFITEAIIAGNAVVKKKANVIGAHYLPVKVSGDCLLTDNIVLLPGTEISEHVYYSPIQINGFQWPILLTENKLSIGGRLISFKSLEKWECNEMKEQLGPEMADFLALHKESFLAMAKLQQHSSPIGTAAQLQPIISVPCHAPAMI